MHIDGGCQRLLVKNMKFQLYQMNELWESNVQPGDVSY